jgi:hypothetical protein
MEKTIMTFKNPTTQEEDIEYEMFSRTLEEWMFDILNDKKLQSACQFDAMDVSQWSEDSFDRLYNEPWTGQMWWDIQVRVDCSLVTSDLWIHQMPGSQSFLTTLGYSASSCMRTRPSYPHSVQRKGIPYMPAVGTFLCGFGMAVRMGASALLDGFQL